MKNYNRLEQISNSFKAAAEIQNLYSNKYRQSEDTRVGPSSSEMLSMMLQIIGNYSSGSYRKPLNAATQKCTNCTQAYRNLKQLFSTRGQKANLDFIAETMDTIRPVLGSREKSAVEKLLRIYSAIKS